MNDRIMNRKLLLGGGLAIVALVSALGIDALVGGSETAAADGDLPVAVDSSSPAQPLGDAQGNAMPAAHGDGGQARQAPPARSGEARQALAGLAQIRQQQCQMGNHLACQALPEIPGHERRLAQFDQGCRTGDRSACASYDGLAQRIMTAYRESAAVMQAGAAGMAQMDAWRARMNNNAAASMDALRARAAAGQAAHEARQESYDAMNRNWEAGQASIDRGHGRFIDGIYEGTTMDGGGVQTRVPYGTRGYTDGHGNVIAIPDGGQAPDGWQAMDPTYAAPD